MQQQEDYIVRGTFAKKYFQTFTTLSSLWRLIKINRKLYTAIGTTTARIIDGFSPFSSNGYNEKSRRRISPDSYYSCFKSILSSIRHMCIYAPFI